LKVLFVASEVIPYSKTGGLADVAGSLPIALRKHGCEIMLVTPFYRETRQKGFPVHETGKRVTISIGKRPVQATLLKSLTAPFPAYFIHQPSYFDRDFLYGDERGDYADNAERFSFFARAALEASIAQGFHPDVIHCHDWQTGLIPAYLKTSYARHPAFQKTGTVFTIHNLSYQGNFERHHYYLTGLSDDLFRMDGLEFYGRFSFLKAGIQYADIITTVSRTYRNEILGREYGCGMEGVLGVRERALKGIVNGIDYEKWDPTADKDLAATFSSKDRRGKAVCRRSLLRYFGLSASANTPVIALITRLAQQKGIDLIIEAMDSLMTRDLCLLVLGSGNPEYEEFFQRLPYRYPGRAAVHINFREDLAHKIYAGADIFLMPSIFEPCGISQLIAMRYGTVPLVHAVGGLKDTVSHFNHKTHRGSGFRFQEFSAKKLLGTLDRAITEFRKKSSWGKLVQGIMEQDHSWEPPAKEYLGIYRKARRARANGVLKK